MYIRAEGLLRNPDCMRLTPVVFSSVEICLFTRYIYPMTGHQFAIAAGARTKWVLNSAALLGRDVRHTPADARWWGLLRLLTESLGLPLQPAAAATTRCLRKGGSVRQISVNADPSESVSVLVDLHRYHSTFLGNLSRALVLETPKRRGRPSRPLTGSGARGSAAVESAVHYGVDLGLIKAALDRTPAERLEMLESNARFIRGMRQRGK